MTPEQIDAYVNAALPLLGYSFDEARRAAIVAEFLRISTVAAQFVDEALPDEQEALAQFRP